MIEIDVKFLKYQWKIISSIQNLKCVTELVVSILISVFGRLRIDLFKNSSKIDSNKLKASLKTCYFDNCNSVK